jgi:hypothetical protein
MTPLLASLSLATSVDPGKTISWTAVQKGVFDANVTLRDLTGTLAGDAVNSAATVANEKSLKDFIKLARADAKALGKLTSPYELITKTESAYNSPRLANLTTNTYVYTGGAHGNYFFRSYTYGAIEGPLRELKLADFFAKGSHWPQDLTFALLTKLQTRSSVSSIDSGPVRDFKEEDLKTFSVQADGLTFYFDPYVLGSWAEGPQRVKLSIAELGPNFKKGYLLQR